MGHPLFAGHAGNAMAVSRISFIKQAPRIREDTCSRNRNTKLLITPTVVSFAQAHTSGSLAAHGADHRIVRLPIRADLHPLPPP